MMAATTKATQTLPELIAIVAYNHTPPVDGECVARCPHCGAHGAHVWGFICADGTRRGAMRECLKLFPVSRNSNAKLIMQAFERKMKAEREQKRLASWWSEMVAAAEDFGANAPYADHSAIVNAQNTMYSRVIAAEQKRQTWLDRNGYRRRYR